MPLFVGCNGLARAEKVILSSLGRLVSTYWRLTKGHQKVRDLYKRSLDVCFSAMPYLLNLRPICLLTYYRGL